MTLYPGELDEFSNPGPSTTMDAPGFDHDVEHANLNDAVAALQAKVGVDNSTDETSIDNKLMAATNQLAGMIRASVAIGSGASNGSVTGLELGFTPTTVIMTVQMPDSSGEVIWASLTAAPTSDGFNYQLSGATDRTGYKLHYFIIA